MGGIGGPAANTRQAYEAGHIGVMSRSGGMTTEIASTLTAAGLGQSTCVSIGGDAIIGGVDRLVSERHAQHSVSEGYHSI